MVSNKTLADNDKNMMNGGVMFVLYIPPTLDEPTQDP
jgi:hypothetical protein